MYRGTAGVLFASFLGRAGLQLVEPFDKKQILTQADCHDCGTAESKRSRGPGIGSGCCKS